MTNIPPTRHSKKRRAPLLLAVIVLVPILLLAWYGVKDRQNQQQLIRLQFNSLIDQQLQQLDQRLQNHFFDLQEQLIPDARRLALLQADQFPAAELRDYLKQAPLLDQLFVLSADGERVFPPQGDSLNRTEQAFLERTRSLLESPELFDVHPADPNLPQPGLGTVSQQPQRLLQNSRNSQNSQQEPQQEPQQEQQQEPQQEQQQEPPKFDSSVLVRGTLETTDNRQNIAAGVRESQPHGWVVWYADSGQLHIFWWQDEAGNRIGFVLNSARLLSDLINRLPETAATTTDTEGAQLQLINDRGAVSYAWGRQSGNDFETPLRIYPLSHPLGSWRLGYFSRPLENPIDWFSLIALLLALSAGLGTLAWLLYREQQRELRLAEQRVNFVNQVSHELKTPLTNVRLYAEMLDQQLPPEEEDPLAKRYLSVITSESQRLSRLIENVLSFSRLKRGNHRISRKAAVVDDSVWQIIHNFTPALADRQLQIRFEGQATRPCRFDGEALEQILNNLIGNSEKYAADGRYIDIHSWQQQDQTCIRVRDYGPGIDPSESEQIFEPFYRLNDSLTEGVSGTGIGLGLARDLARAHGGELTLEQPEPTESTDIQGSSFLLILETPPSKQDDSPNKH